MTASSKVAEAITTFNWGNYSFDEVAESLDDPNCRDWVVDLTAAILKALDAQPFHTVNLQDDGWTLKHPLDCRDRLFECEYNAATGALDGTPASGPGVYRVSLNERGLLVIEERVGG